MRRLFGVVALTLLAFSANASPPTQSGGSSTLSGDTTGLSSANTTTKLGNCAGFADCFGAAGATTGNSPTLSVTGSDTNINLTLSAKGSGVITSAYGETLSYAPVASASALTLTGVPYIGTGTTSVPLLYLNAAGAAAPTTWNTEGTYIGVNAAAGGFTGAFIDFHANGGSSLFSVSANGAVSAASSIAAGNGIQLSSATQNLYIPATNSAVNSTSSSLLFGGASSVDLRVGFPGAGTASIPAGASYSNVIVGASPVTTPGSGTNAWLANAVINPIGTITSGGATVTNTASLYVAANTATIGTNNYGIYNAGTLANAGVIEEGYATIASAATIAPVTPLVIISGTTTITTITAPAGMNSTTGGCIDIVSTGTWSTATGGNILMAITATNPGQYRACYTSAGWTIK